MRPIGGNSRKGWRGFIVAALVTLGPGLASADELVLNLEPERTSVTFRVRATLLDIDGALAMAGGQIRFDPDTGAAAGQVTVDLRQARTGNWLRDLALRRSVLGTERWPAAVFRPDRILGLLSRSGVSDLMLAGIVTVHGSEHAVALPVRVDVSGDAMSAEAILEIPYVAWGLPDPSVLFLRVAPVAAVTVRTEGHLRPEALARRAARAP